MKKEYTKLVQKVFQKAKEYYKEDLISFVVFGSYAKDTLSPNSDIDILIITKKQPKSRTKRIINFINNVEKKLEKYIESLRKKNIFVEISPIIKTQEEVEYGSFLFLDMIQDSIILYDRDNFFKEYLDSLDKKLKEYGSKKVFKKGGYYWIIKENVNPKEGINL
jgi:predicted nucleotidyltransferase